MINVVRFVKCSGVQWIVCVMGLVGVLYGGEL